jgi:hypothetical protein
MARSRVVGAHVIVSLLPSDLIPAPPREKELYVAAMLSWEFVSTSVAI